ncbi:hypothetical protein D6855_07205 [Butyrivibrio sp. CB08]|uniref:hypothetical protein n=1 Tax=Butyrivibrio sp. CB08 TaxID=2364879 RepID=UPI000EAA808E|nr:hypothetical protein [Butyrivibrio sp. CB08]RKM60496.1 hypothetical protein D6855_07205 [Butyrivibrio sp. CB08]
MSRALRRRLQAMKTEITSSEDVGAILKFIDSGAYYDELTDEEKDAYCRYLGTERDALETVNGYVLGCLHFQLNRRPKPPTDAEHRATVKEVESYFDARIAEYNSPKARAQREADYQRQQRICHKSTTPRGVRMNS